MTGKIRLVDAVLEIVKEVGQHHVENRGSFNFAQGDDLVSTMNIWIATNKNQMYGSDYEIEVDNMMNRVKIKLGKFPEFDFTDPDSIVLFKSALMQMPTLITLRNMRNELDRMLESDSYY